LKGALSRNHLVQDCAERKYVRARVHILAFGLFRRHVGNGPHNHALRGLRVILQHGSGCTKFAGRIWLGCLGKSEIYQLDRAIGSHQNVARLQIAVDDTGLMRGTQCGGNLRRVTQSVAQRECLMPNHLGQGLGLDVLHHDAVRAIAFGNVVNLHDIRMVQRRRSARFPSEAAFAVWIARLGSRKNFDCNEPIEARVAGFPNFAHASSADG
jgi:hypothetical protein